MTADEERWIVIPNWSDFQHYSNRDPTWIKVYHRTLTSPEWLRLSDADRGLLLFVWLAYARCDGTLNAHDLHTMRTGGAHVRNPTRTFRALHCSLDRLNHAGLIEFSASAPLALARSREVLRTKETEESALARAREEPRAASAQENGVPPEPERDPEALAKIRALAAGIGRSDDNPLLQ